jgi:hypothetical protein
VKQIEDALIERPTFRTRPKRQSISDGLGNLLRECVFLPKEREEICIPVFSELGRVLEITGGEHEEAHQASLVDEGHVLALEDVLLASGNYANRTIFFIYSGTLQKFVTSVSRDARVDERSDERPDGGDERRC